MFDVCLLGTGGMLPLPDRFLTSCLIRYGGSSLLIDCGEGTQVTLRLQGWSPKDIDYILFTHYHADHIAGLPGLLLTIGNCERQKPLTLIGPKGLSRIVAGLLVIDGALPFELQIVELTPAQMDGQEMKLGPFLVHAARCDHGVLCVGYSVEIRRLPRFDPEKAKANQVPLKFWNPLQKGGTVTGEDGTVYTPSMVLAEERKGLKVTYVTDSRPRKALSDLAAGSDLFICEGMYGHPDKQDRAKDHKHMSFQEAAALAEAAGVRELWLTHFSPAEPNPRQYLSEAKAVFPNTKCGKDRMTREFVYDT